MPKVGSLTSELLKRDSKLLALQQRVDDRKRNLGRNSHERAFLLPTFTFDETSNGLQKSAFREQHMRIPQALDGGLLLSSYICAARTSAVTLMISASH